MGKQELDWFATGQGESAGCFEHCNELSVSIKYGDFLPAEELIVLKKDSTP
jgi:hypothetical protein